MEEPLITSRIACVPDHFFSSGLEHRLFSKRSLIKWEFHRKFWRVKKNSKGERQEEMPLENDFLALHETNSACTAGQICSIMIMPIMIIIHFVI